MLNDLKRAVCKANKELPRHNLAKFDWGTVSAFDMSMGAFVIKPAGVDFEDLQPELMVVMSMEGQKMEGRLEPAEGVALHRAIYCSWPLQVGAVVHTQSLYATAFAQAGRAVDVFGSVHAKYFGGAIPVTRELTTGEIESDGYEYRKGILAVEAAGDPLQTPAALIHGHGPVAWGKDCMEAVRHAVILEAVAKMSYLTRAIAPDAHGLNPSLQKKLSGR